MPRRHHHIWTGLGISLLVHMLVLGYWINRTPPALILASQPGSLSVSLTSEEQAVARTKNIAMPRPAAIRKKTTPRKHRNPKSKPVQHAEATLNRASLPESRSADSKQPTSESAVPKKHAETANLSLQRARILAHLRQEYNQYWYYPRLAQRRSIEGTVILGVGLNPQGNIHQIRIVKSSGYAILDLAAQDAMQQLQHADSFRSDLHDNTLNIELPVIYRLIRN